MMRSFILSFCTLCLLGYGCMAQQPIAVSIRGQISGADNRYMYLYSYSKDANRDSVKIENSRFEYRGTLDDPDFFYIRVPGKKVTTFFFNGGELSVSEKSDSTLEVKGEGVKDWERYQHKVAPLEAAMKINTRKFNEKRRSGTIEERTALNKEYNYLDSAIRAVKAGYIREYPNTCLSAWFVAQSYQRKMITSEIIALYEALGDDAKQSVYGKRVKADIDLNAKVGVGVVAPDFKLLDKDGREISLSGFRGKYVLLDFWGSWCTPCRASHPHLVQLYNTYKSDQFEVIGLAARDPDRAKWLEAIRKDGLVWPQINLTENRDRQDVASEYVILGYPTKILIDPRGVIMVRILGGAVDELDEKLKEVFGF